MRSIFSLCACASQASRFARTVGARLPRRRLPERGAGAWSSELRPFHCWQNSGMRTELFQGDDSDLGEESLGRFGQLEWHRQQRVNVEQRLRHRRFNGNRSNTPSEAAEENKLQALHSLSDHELLRVGSPLSDAHSSQELPPPPLSSAHAAADDVNASGTPSKGAQWPRRDAADDVSNTPLPPSRPGADRPGSPPPRPPLPVGGSPSWMTPGRDAASHAGLSSREIFAAIRTPGSRHLPNPDLAHPNPNVEPNPPRAAARCGSRRAPSVTLTLWLGLANPNPNPEP